MLTTIAVALDHLLACGECCRARKRCRTSCGLNNGARLISSIGLQRVADFAVAGGGSATRGSASLIPQRWCRRVGVGCSATRSIDRPSRA
jgi:hypothetical protein